MLECALCRKDPRSCWRWTPMGRILSRLLYTTWSRIRTRRPRPVRSRLSIDARSCAKPVQKKTKALARRLGTPVLECFLAFYRLVVFFLNTVSTHSQSPNQTFLFFNLQQEDVFRRYI